jgi:hypothetical protein
MAEAGGSVLNSWKNEHNSFNEKFWQHLPSLRGFQNLQEKPQHEGQATQKISSHGSSIAGHMTSITIQIERPDKFKF